MTEKNKSLQKKAFLIILLLVTLSGCVVIAAGVGAGTGVIGYRYVKERLEITYGASYPKVRKAVIVALDRLKVRIKDYRYDEFEGFIKGELASGKPLEIYMKKVSKESTLVTIKVGLLGDKSKSMAIKEEIDRELGIKGGYL